MAIQLVHGEIGSRLDVILGGGIREFLPVNSSRTPGKFGRRTDDRDLIEEWLDLHKDKSTVGVVYNWVNIG